MSPSAHRRIVGSVKLRILAASLVALSASAQTGLSLRDAVRMALTSHPSMEAGTARIQAAESRIGQARSGRLPRVQYMESFQSGNNPVYVFGSLLTQRQFTAANFALSSLNAPDPLNNFQSTLTAEHLVYDFGGLKNSIKAAELGKAMSEQEKKAAELALIAGVARAYHGVTLTGESLKVAREALTSAEADQKRAETVRNAGMATDADVLSANVQVAAMREQVIRAEADLKVARAALNEAMGQPLDTQFELTTALTVAPPPTAQTTLDRPEISALRLARQAADAQAAGARAGYRPQIFLRGVLEADRQQFVTKGGGNWMFAAGLKWTLFDGYRTRQAIAEAGAMAAVATAGEKQMTSAAKLEIRKAQAALEAGSERVKVSQAAVAQAEESLRIVRNRYSSGLATVTELLRTQTALAETRMRRLGAIYDERMAAVAMEQAQGILNGDSNVLQ